MVAPAEPQSVVDGLGHRRLAVLDDQVTTPVAV